jgi:hypothetical protein
MVQTLLVIPASIAGVAALNVGLRRRERQNTASYGILIITISRFSNLESSFS